jgi:hypothetical protein
MITGKLKLYFNVEESKSRAFVVEIAVRPNKISMKVHHWPLVP